MRFLFILYLSSVNAFYSSENLTEIPRFLKAALENYNFHTMLWLYPQNCRDWMESEETLVDQLAVIPMIHIGKPNGRQQFHLKEHFNSELLVLICLQSLDHVVRYLEGAFRTLQYLKSSSKLIFYINTPTPANYEDGLESLYHYCFHESILNALLIFKDFPRTRKYFSYQPFPQYRLIVNWWHYDEKNKDFFPERLTNLYGYNILTIPEQMISRSGLRSVNGNQDRIILTGYVGRLLNLFAERLNASLKFPFPVRNGEIMFYGDMEMLTWNRTIDITGALIPSFNTSLLPYYSDTYVLVRMCLMIPLAGPVPIAWTFCYIFVVNLLFSYIFTLLLNARKYQMRKPLRSIDFILNDTALRGILGSSYTERMQSGAIMKFLYILLNTTGLYLSVILSAYLNSILTHPLKQKQPRTFSDVYQAGLTLMVSLQDWRFFYDFQTLPPMVKPYITTWEDFHYHRDHLNTSFVYATNNLLWQTYFARQQRYYPEDIFIYSNEACFPGRVPLSFSLPEPSIYRARLNRLLLEVRANGLINYWFNTNYMDTQLDYMENYHLMAAETHRKKKPKFMIHYLSFEDFEWLCLFYIGAICISFLIFLIEMIVYQLRSRLKRKHNTEQA